MMMFGRGWFAGGSCLMGGGFWGGLMMFGLFLIAVAVILLIVGELVGLETDPKTTRCSMT